MGTEVMNFLLYTWPGAPGYPAFFFWSGGPSSWSFRQRGVFSCPFEDKRLPFCFLRPSTAWGGGPGAPFPFRGWSSVLTGKKVWTSHGCFLALPLSPDLERPSTPFFPSGLHRLPIFKAVCFSAFLTRTSSCSFPPPPAVLRYRLSFSWRGGQELFARAWPFPSSRQGVFFSR